MADWQDIKGFGKLAVTCVAALVALAVAVKWAFDGGHTNWGILVAALYFEWRLNKTNDSIDDLRGRLRELQERNAPRVIKDEH